MTQTIHGTSLPIYGVMFMGFSCELISSPTHRLVWLDLTRFGLEAGLTSRVKRVKDRRELFQ